jgi:hypothetical protein
MAIFVISGVEPPNSGVNVLVFRNDVGPRHSSVSLHLSL